MRVTADQKPVFGPILGGFRAPNQFLAQFPAGFGLQIDFWREMRVAAGFKSIFGVKRGSRGLKFHFWRNPRVAADQNPVFGAIRGSFWAKNRFAARGEGHFTVPV